MKIAVCSDLHLEFAELELRNTENADVLVLSGDVLVAEDLHRFPTMYAPVESHRYVNSRRYLDFMSMVNSEFPRVVYVAGNHEFYDGKWNKTLAILKESLENFENVFFLEDDFLEVGDFTFVGCTLWTDMNNGDPLTMHSVVSQMNDYRKIVNEDGGYTKLRAAHTVGRHAKSKKFIRQCTANPDKKYVVCTHHAPSMMSIPDRFLGDRDMNGAYASNLNDFILDRPQIKLWTHGHTHDVWDYMIGETRVVCNPRGYKNYERRAEEFALKFVDIE